MMLQFVMPDADRLRQVVGTQAAKLTERHAKFERPALPIEVRDHTKPMLISSDGSCLFVVSEQSFLSSR